MEDIPPEERMAREDPLAIVLDSLRRIIYEREIISSEHLELSVAAKSRGDYCTLVDFFENKQVIPHASDLGWMLEAVGGESWIQEWVPQVFGESTTERINVQWILDRAQARYKK